MSKSAIALPLTTDLAHKFYYSIDRFKICFTEPYISLVNPSNSCSISSQRPNLLVHFPLDNCLAACVGSPSGVAYIAIFSKPDSNSELSQGSYPSV
jgi:hypothetical protein